MVKDSKVILKKMKLMVRAYFISMMEGSSKENGLKINSSKFYDF